MFPLSALTNGKERSCKRAERAEALTRDIIRRCQVFQTLHYLPDRVSLGETCSITLSQRSSIAS